MNLMRNALEAMAGLEQRALTIIAARAGEKIEIRVADTGPGLPEQVRDRLFEPFVTTKPDGMGVGLSVCRTIVRHTGATQRRRQGRRGHCFRLTIPVAEEPISALNPDGRQMSSALIDVLRLICVNDGPEHTRYCSMLRQGQFSGMVGPALKVETYVA